MSCDLSIDGLTDLENATGRSGEIILEDRGDGGEIIAVRFTQQRIIPRVEIKTEGGQKKTAEIKHVHAWEASRGLGKISKTVDRRRGGSGRTSSTANGRPAR